MHIGAELKLMLAASPGERVGELPLLRFLEFRKKVWRPDKGVDVCERDHGDAAGEGWIVRNARNQIPARQAEWLLLGERIVVLVSGAEFVHQTGRDRPRPANYGLVRS